MNFDWIPNILKIIISAPIFTLSLAIATGIVLFGPTQVSQNQKLAVVYPWLSLLVHFVFYLSTALVTIWTITSIQFRQFLKYIGSFFVQLYIRRKDRKEALVRIRHALANLSTEEQAFMSLFKEDEKYILRGPTELLPHSIYIAHNLLIRKGIITITKQKPRSSIETFKLSNLAIKVITRTYQEDKIRNIEISLDLNHVAGSGASGGGSLSR